MNECYANISILFADDATSSQQHYAKYLGQLFHNVYMAADGKTAWELYKSLRPDIVLLDIEMPQLDGLALARKIRERDYRTRIIMASGHGNEKRLLQAVELGLTRFLPKPFGRQALKEALAKAVSELDISPRVALSRHHQWDRNERKLYHGNHEIRLTPNEQALLSLLSSHPGRTFTLLTIEMHLWPNTNCESDINARLKPLLKRLRQKLPPGSIENIYGEGYRLISPR